MAAFSPSDAALEGFQVLRKHWRVVVGWAIFNLLGMVAIIVAASVVTVALVATRAIGETALGGVGSFVAVGGDLLIQTIVTVGLYRMILRPDEPGFLHLRIGIDELRVLTVAVVSVGAVGGIGVVAYVLAMALRPVSTAGPVLVAVVSVVSIFWLAMRFCLAAPISVAERKLDFARSWRLTRGSAWSLFGMWLLNLFVVLMVWIAWWILAFVVVGLLTGFGARGEGAEAFMSHPVRYLLEGASPLLFAPVILVLQQTPFVAAYQALSAGREAEA